MTSPHSNTKAEGALGIFDSGIGGLTVANALRKILPHENLIYFGDTAHLPYGDKSAKTVRGYSKRIAEFLLERKCKAIIIACNTASSVAYNNLKKITANKALCINAVDPVAAYVAKKNHKKIGVIGTKGTINSRIYVRRVQKLKKDIQVVQKATPLLAPMIEEGFFNNYISKTIINSYLGVKQFNDIEALILGCTHYPLIEKEVGEYFGNKTEIVNSADIVAWYIKERLSKSKLLNPQTKAGKQQFFVSDYTEAFEESTKIFFRDEIHLRKADIWKE